MNRRRTLVIGGGVAVALVVVAVVVVSRRGSDEDTGPARPEPTTTTSSSTEPVGDEEVPGFRFLPEDLSAPGTPSPLTGLPITDAIADRPLLAVKVDNLDVPGETARPQSGPAFADVVVEEVVEGGITRLVLLLHSTEPPDVGPVRSARTTDVHLLPAFGSALFAYSGGNPGVLSAVRSSPSIIDRGGEGEPAYTRVPDRERPHDLFLRPQEVWSRPGDATPPRTLARFVAPGGAPTGEAVRGVTIEHPGIGTSPVRWEWLAPARRWVRYQRDALHVDASGDAIGPRNVVIAVIDEVPSPADPRSPEAVTVGSGEAWVLVGGHRIVGRWERRTEGDPFSFIDAAGEPITLTAGRTWIHLVPAGRAQILR